MHALMDVSTCPERGSLMAVAKKIDESAKHAVLNIP